MQAKLLTIREMAERLSVSVKTLRRDVREKQIPFITVGRSMRFDPAAVICHLKARSAEAAMPSVKPVGVKLPRVKKGKAASRFAEAMGV